MSRPRALGDTKNLADLIDAQHPYMRRTLLERFEAHVPDRPEEGCWHWDGRRDQNRYGQFYLSRTVVQAHRLSYYLATWEEPGRREVCHACDNPSCVRPGHLFLGTQRDNVYDGMAKGRINHTAVNEARWSAVRGASQTDSPAPVGQSGLEGV